MVAVAERVIIEGSARTACKVRNVHDSDITVCGYFNQEGGSIESVTLAPGATVEVWSGLKLGTATLTEPDRRWRFRSSRLRCLLHRVLR